MDNFDKYEHMRKAGVDAQAVYLTAKADGIDAIACLRLLRNVFQLSIAEAKEVTIVADKLAPSLDEYQASLIPGLEKVLNNEEPLEDDSTSQE